MNNLEYAEFDRVDICEAYLVLEWDYNMGGWLQERPSNRRKMRSTSVQLASKYIQFNYTTNLCYETLSDNGKAIYNNQVIKLGLPVYDEL